MIRCSKIPIQISLENIKYIDNNNISYAKFVNTVIELAKLGYININKINDLSVKFQQGEYNDREIKEMFRL